MSGHSKWASIKHKKGATDAARGRIFSKFARELTVVSKQTGGNIASPQLAAVIARAKAVNMPKDSIERAVAKGQSKEASDLEQVVYEFYGPGGIAIVVNALTDSRNRTTQEIKLILTKNQYELGTPGSAAWAFTKTPDGRYHANEPLMEVTGDDEEKLGRLLELLDEQDDVQEVTTNANGFESTAEDGEDS